MKKIILSLGTILLLLAIIFYFFWDKSDNSELIVKPKKGTFYIVVVATGSLRAVNSIDINGPRNLQFAGIYDLRINQLIPEGTIVDSGDFVAEIDKSQIMDKIKEKQLSVDKFQSEYTQAKLDSTLELSAARDQLENLKFELEEMKILKEQSKYEPPATLRQAEISYQKVLRSYNQALNNYETKRKKSIAKISTVYADLQKAQNQLDRLLELLKGFTITAPAHGMLIYRRNWDGRTIETGSEINIWYPVVATLPDLSKMESISFVNEVDIQKIKKGQFVEITLDANPDKKFTGKVTKVANIGEELRGSESKVFRVNILVNQKDSTLLPSMTTNNKIFTKTIKNVLFIPLECIHETTIDNHKIKFVYRKDNSSIVKQEVKVGDYNDNEIVILQGLDKNSEILLNEPLNSQDLNFVRLPKNIKQNKK